MSLLTTRRDGDLLWVTLNDPERANALSPALIGELIDLYRRPLRAEGVRALILSGAGRNFSAAGALEPRLWLSDAGPEENLRDSLRLRDILAVPDAEPADGRPGEVEDDRTDHYLPLDAVKRALELLKSAKKPLIILGKGAAYAQAMASWTAPDQSITLSRPATAARMSRLATIASSIRRSR